MCSKQNRILKCKCVQHDYMNKWIKKKLTKHMSCECKCKLMEENVIQINSGITININVSVKYVMYAKKIIFGMMLHVVVKNENI